MQRAFNWLTHLASVGNCLLALCQQSTWLCLQWDESFISQRKGERGQRARNEGTLIFSGGTQTTGQGSVIQGVVQMVPSKAAADIIPLITHLAADGAVIWTDGAAMYKQLSSAARSDGSKRNFTHDSVNHKKNQFAKTAKSGRVTSNAVEGFWSQIKNLAKQYFGHYPKAASQAACLWQFCAFVHNASLLEVPPASALCQLLDWGLNHPFQQRPDFAQFLQFAMEWVGAEVEDAERKQKEQKE